jgi:hypothetical protein
MTVIRADVPGGRVRWVARSKSQSNQAKGGITTMAKKAKKKAAKKR